MGTVPMPLEPEETKADEAKSLARNIIAGHPQGAVRRLILYIITVGVLLTGEPQLAIIPLFMLAATDQLA